MSILYNILLVVLVLLCVLYFLYLEHPYAIDRNIFMANFAHHREQPSATNNSGVLIIAVLFIILILNIFLMLQYN
jgi:hypothetical protein